VSASRGNAKDKLQSVGDQQCLQPMKTNSIAEMELTSSRTTESKHVNNCHDEVSLGLERTVWAHNLWIAVRIPM